MKIVLLNPTGVLGGGERSLLDLIVSLRACDLSLEMHLIVCDPGPLVEAARGAGASAEVLPMPKHLARAGDSAMRGSGRGYAWVMGMSALIGAGLDARAYMRRLDETIAAVRPDVVHSNGIKTHLLASLSRVDVPMVWHLRDFVGDRPIVRRMLWRGAGRASGILAVSRAVAADARAWLGRKAASVPLDVVYNGIDTEHFSPGDGDGAFLDRLARLPQAPDQTIRVGLVATYARWKGHDVLLEAAARLRRRGTDRAMRFYLVGGPIYRTPGSQFGEEELRELMRRLGVSECVGFIPFQYDPAPVYRALDIVVHASTRPEPFGRTIAEAMACGNAVIVSKEGGAAELIRDGHDALAVRPRDASALAEAITRLADDPNLRVQLGNAARTSAERRFSRQRLGPQVLEIYRRTCGDRL